MEHAGGLERIEGEQYVVPHMHVHCAKQVAQQDHIHLHVHHMSKQHMYLCRIQCHVLCPYHTKPRCAPSACCYMPPHVSSAQLITHCTSVHLRLMPFSPLSVRSSCGSISRSCISVQVYMTVWNHTSSSTCPNSMFSHSGMQMRCGGGTWHGCRVSEV